MSRTSVLGNTLANETAKTVNRQNIPAMLDATNSIRCHCARQVQDLIIVYPYLVDLNTLLMAYEPQN